jgi:hypothetical protein
LTAAKAVAVGFRNQARKIKKVTIDQGARRHRHVTATAELP